MTSAADLGQVLGRLAPPGYVFPRAPGSVGRSLLDGLAGTPNELQAALAAILREIDPRTTLDLLPDFERLLGLPGACAAGVVQTLGERRAAVVQRLTALRGATPAELVSLAAALGLVAEVVEFRPFVAGRSVAGDLLANTGGGWLFAVELRAPVASGRFFRAGESSAGDALWSSTRPTLECLIEDSVPGHVVATFAYDLEATTDYQPWNPATVRPASFGAAPSVPTPTLSEA